MIIQEPIKATISFALENFAFSDAIFICERLHAEVDNDESLFLLANSYYRDRKPNVAYVLLTEKHGKICKTSRCLFLLAKCCYELNKHNEALETLTGPFFTPNLAPERETTKLIGRDEMIQFYGEISSFVAQLLGAIYLKLDFGKLSAHYYSLSLKINPFLWSSYEKLLQIDPSSIEPSKLLTVDNFEFRYSCGTNPLINLLNSSNSTQSIITPSTSHQQQQQQLLTSQHTATLSDNTNTSHSFQTPQPPQSQLQCGQNAFRKIEISTPYAIIKQSLDNVNKLDVITPETNGSWHTMACLAPNKPPNTPGKVANRKAAPQAALKSLNNNNDTLFSGSPAIGAKSSQPQQVISRNLQTCWESDEMIGVAAHSRHTFGVLQLDEQSLSEEMTIGTTPLKSKNRDHASPGPATKKPYTRRNMQQDFQDINMMDLNANATIGTRRSTRLLGNQCVKENTTSTKTTKAIRTPIKRSRRGNSFEKTADQKELNDLTDSNENLKVVTSIDLAKAGVRAQRSSAFGLLELMAKFGAAYKLLSEFKCKEAISEFESFPLKHKNTGFILSSIGRAYFEMSKYEESISYFKRCRQLEPYRMQGMEIYSTALWHQQREVELSCLSQTMIDFDKHSPETWCAAGNCFSLQKEHEISIKFLKRAIQVNPDFPYAYTLLGHELVSADELDNAMACFRNAARIDARHYNAWYGIGMIFYKQQKYNHAFDNYRRALKISPYNPLLMCHLAIVCHQMKKSKQALEILDRASKLDPSNALVKFHRASINFATDKYALAMEELKQLKQIVPKESMVYFLIGRIHKIQGETHLALMNFSWAMDLDPKGASNQIKELIDRHYGNDDEIMIHSNGTPHAGGNNNSVGGGSSGGGGGGAGNTSNISTPSIDNSSFIASTLIIGPSPITSSPNSSTFGGRGTLTPSGGPGPSGLAGSAIIGSDHRTPAGAASAAVAAATAPTTTGVNHGQASLASGSGSGSNSSSNGSNNSNNISNNSGGVGGGSSSTTTSGTRGRHTSVRQFMDANFSPSELADLDIRVLDSSDDGGFQLGDDSDDDEDDDEDDDDDDVGGDGGGGGGGGGGDSSTDDTFDLSDNRNILRNDSFPL